MRLLHFNRAGRLLLEDFSGKATPQYATLSHRWGESEVLFEDIANGNYKTKKGYRKIDFCANQAAKDDLQYFWVDTCCIDRWNVSELSQSINLMFLWYKNATKCYVFLPDVSIASATKQTKLSQPTQRYDWEASFRASEWFTRGWTLQELIAPVSVNFFSSEGQFIGDKRSLELLIHEITNIPVEALQNCPLNKYTIQERTRWARNRETTEEEDMVYCLLGILNVSMLLSYGEGHAKAQERLKSEIGSSAQSLIPFSRNEKFVGYESHLAKLEAMFFRGRQVVTIAVVGPGGTGKSQLALEHAYRIRERNKDCSVFWIDASSIDAVHQSYASVARKLNIPGWNNEKTDVTRIVKLHLSKQEAGQSLLIFDNADNDDLQSHGLSTARASALVDYLPQSELCSILFTTTSSDIANRLAPQNIIEIQEMTPYTAKSMMEHCLNTTLSRNDWPDAKLLLQELSYLPLSIVQAAAYMNTQNITLQDYRLQLARQRQNVLQTDDNLERNKIHEHGTESSVPTTLLSISQIRYKNPLAASYLFFAACVDRKDILLEFLEAPSAREREDAIRFINSYKLITRRPAESALDLHRLVHSALRGWLQKQGTLEQWTKVTIERLAKLFPNDNHENRSKWRRMLPHAKYALSHRLGDQEAAERMDLAWKCAKALWSDGRYSESKDLYVQVVKAREKALGAEHPKTLASVNNLGLVLKSQGKYKEAEAMHRRDIEVTEKVYGVEHPSTLISVNNLGSVLLSQGKYKEAEAMHQRALQVRERVLGVEHPSTLVSVDSLGQVFLSQGKYKDAEAMHQRALQVQEKVLGVEHPETLTSVNNLGLVLLSQGKYKEAEAMYRRALQVRERVLGVEHPETLVSVDGLGRVLRERGKYKAAETLSRRALEGFQKKFGSKNPDTLISKECLASVLRDQGKYEAAEALNRRVLDEREKLLGKEHPSTLTSVSNLALLLHGQRKYEVAEEMNRRALKVRERVLGKEHPHTLESVHGLAGSLAGQKIFGEAETLYRRASETRRNRLGPQHPDTLVSLSGLAHVLHQQVRYEEATILYQRACDGLRQVLGSEHPKTVTCLNRFLVMQQQLDTRNLAERTILTVRPA